MGVNTYTITNTGNKTAVFFFVVFLNQTDFPHMG